MSKVFESLQTSVIKIRLQQKKKKKKIALQGFYIKYFRKLLPLFYTLKPDNFRMDVSSN